MTAHRAKPSLPAVCTTRFGFLKLSLAAVLYPFLGGCSPAPMQVAQSTKDPSSPNAPEGVSPVVPPDARMSGSVYVCPMHPDVTSTKSGEVCPKCNMKLVPKE